jgi:hypothetical protein
VHIVAAIPAHVDFIRRMVAIHVAEAPLHYDPCLRFGRFERRRMAKGGTVRFKS